MARFSGVYADLGAAYTFDFLIWRRETSPLVQLQDRRHRTHTTGVHVSSRDVRAGRSRPLSPTAASGSFFRGQSPQPQLSHHEKSGVAGSRDLRGRPDARAAGKPGGGSGTSGGARLRGWESGRNARAKRDLATEGLPGPARGRFRNPSRAAAGPAMAATVSWLPPPPPPRTPMAVRSGPPSFPHGFAPRPPEPVKPGGRGAAEGRREGGGCVVQAAAAAAAGGGGGGGPAGGQGRRRRSRRRVARSSRRGSPGAEGRGQTSAGPASTTRRRPSVGGRPEMRVSSGSGRGGGRQRRPGPSRGVAVTRAAASEPGLPGRPEAPRRAAARQNGGRAGQVVGVGRRGRSGAGRPGLSHRAGWVRPGSGLARPGPGYALGKKPDSPRPVAPAPRLTRSHPSLPLGPAGSARPGPLWAAGLVLSGSPGHALLRRCGA